MGTGRRRPPGRPPPPRSGAAGELRGPRPGPRRRRRTARSPPGPAAVPSRTATPSSCRPAGAPACPRGSCTPTTRCGPRPGPARPGSRSTRPPTAGCAASRSPTSAVSPSSLRALTFDMPLEVHERFDADAVIDAARRGATLTSLVPTALGPPRSVGLPAHHRRRLGPAGRRPAQLPDQLRHDRDRQRRRPRRSRPPRGGAAGRRRRGPGAGRHAPALLPRRHRPPHARRLAGHRRRRRARPDGTLSVHGRRGDLIITGGENVWPAPVEQVLHQLASVAEVAVVGRPDPEWGQVVTAVDRRRRSCLAAVARRPARRGEGATAGLLRPPPPGAGGRRSPAPCSARSSAAPSARPDRRWLGTFRFPERSEPARRRGKVQGPAPEERRHEGGR